MKPVFIALCLFLSFSVHAKHPIVFIHGIIVPTLAYQFPFSLERFLAHRGYSAVVVNNKSFDTIDEAVKSATRDIRKLIPKGPFHLVGHSQGGLTSRMLAHLPEFKGRILSITTLSTPHHGSMLADRLLPYLYLTQGKLPEWAQECFEKFFGSSIRMVEQVTTTNMQEKFNPRWPDIPEVRYFSMAHYIPTPEWKFTHFNILAVMSLWMKSVDEGPNDGFVGIHSGRWSEHLGDFPGDHVAESFPAPFGNELIVDDVFGRVLENLDRHWP